MSQDSSNQFEVAMRSNGQIVILAFPGAIEKPLSFDEALNLTAWLLAIIQPAEGEVERLVAQIKS